MDILAIVQKRVEQISAAADTGLGPPRGAAEVTGKSDHAAMVVEITYLTQKLEKRYE